MYGCYIYVTDAAATLSVVVRQHSNVAQFFPGPTTIHWRYWQCICDCWGWVSMARSWSFCCLQPTGGTLIRLPSLAHMGLGFELHPRAMQATSNPPASISNSVWLRSVSFRSYLDPSHITAFHRRKTCSRTTTHSKSELHSETYEYDTALLSPCNFVRAIVEIFTKGGNAGFWTNERLKTENRYPCAIRIMQSNRQKDSLVFPTI